VGAVDSVPPGYPAGVLLSSPGYPIRVPHPPQDIQYEFLIPLLGNTVEVLHLLP
jgi:hypothetical protein